MHGSDGIAYKRKGAVSMLVQKIAVQLVRLRQGFTRLETLISQKISKRIIYTRFKYWH